MVTLAERVHEEASKHELSVAEHELLTAGEFTNLISRLHHRARSSLGRHLLGVGAYGILGWLCIGRPLQGYPQWFSLFCAIGFLGMCAVHSTMAAIAFVESRRATLLLDDLGDEEDAP